jgi:transcription initiation factor TFIIIB Brf1 subunit/transcription initiation factor TFIIB
VNRRTFFRDLGANAHICESVTNDAATYYDKIKAHLNERRPKFNDTVLAAYAIYETLSRHQVPRSVQEIEYLTGSKPGKMFAVESALKLSDTLNCPLDFIGRFCSLLELKFTDETIIREIAKNTVRLRLSNVRPQCAVAVIIQLYCKEKKYKITLKKICEICGVSPTNVHNLIRKMDKTYVDKITECGASI